MPRLTALVILVMLAAGLAMTACARRSSWASKVEQGMCANERATMQLDSATSRAPDLTPQFGALIVRVRSMQSEPIIGARILFRTASGAVVQGATGTDGVALLRVEPEAGTLVFRVLGFSGGRLGFVPRAGYADTVRVIARCAVQVVTTPTPDSGADV